MEKETLFNIDSIFCITTSSKIPCPSLPWNLYNILALSIKICLVKFRLFITCWAIIGPIALKFNKWWERACRICYHCQNFIFHFISIKDTITRKILEFINDIILPRDDSSGDASFLNIRLDFLIFGKRY